MIRKTRCIVLGLSLISCVLLFMGSGMAEEVKLKLPPMPPSIEELTDGKVKIGDMITKDNVSLVKDYLSAGLYKNIQGGMILRMGNTFPQKS